MKEVLDWIKCVFILVAVFGGFVACFVLAIYLRVKDIDDIVSKIKGVAASDTCTLRCLGRKPTNTKFEWFTIGKEYEVTGGDNIYDDTGTHWYVFKYDKLMFEAGGYLFGKVKNEKQ